MCNGDTVVGRLSGQDRQARVCVCVFARVQLFMRSVACPDSGKHKEMETEQQSGITRGNANRHKSLLFNFYKLLSMNKTLASLRSWL